MLLWNNISDCVRIVSTTKKFYNQHLYKIVVYCPAARIILDKPRRGTLADALARREQALSKFMHYNTLRGGARQHISYAALEQLKYFEHVKNSHSNTIRIRVEEPAISIYSNDESTLYQIAQDSPFPDRIREIHRPDNLAAEQALNQGHILIKKDTNFMFKVVLRESNNADSANKQSLVDYLYNLSLDDEVSFSKSLIRNLNAKRTWFPGGYFYAKDEKICTFINLICPGMLSGIFKLSKVE